MITYTFNINDKPKLKTESPGMVHSLFNVYYPTQSAFHFILIIKMANELSTDPPRSRQTLLQMPTIHHRTKIFCVYQFNDYNNENTLFSKDFSLKWFISVSVHFFFFFCSFSFRFLSLDPTHKMCVNTMF